jgi:hypothetical protein
MRRLCLVILVSLTACSGDGPGEPAAIATGRPEIDHALVRQHAEQFDIDLPDRPAGSQQELAAATYILGHLQLAGYSPVLDAIPVRDQVQTSNVIAVPTTGDAPEIVVTVAYDTSGPGDSGAEIGLFLELARALNAADPGHAVAFAALGAETEDSRGSAGLAAFFEEQGLEPSVISIATGEGTGGRLHAVGSCATTSSGLGSYENCVASRLSDDPLSSAGFQHTVLTGDTGELGGSLFEFLLDAGD